MGQSTENNNSDYAIILFDGYCNFCSNSVRFIHKRDYQNYFRFAGLESKEGEELVNQYTEGERSFNSVILIEDNKLYSESTAALRITRKLSGLWPIFYVLILVPKGIRDAVYRLIARKRYEWFGKKENCFIPEKELKERFL